jgi:hypothetical protein
MALLKPIPTDFGAEVLACYWNIGAVQEDFKGQGTEVTFYGYASKEAREAGKQPLSAGKVQIAGEEYVAGADRAPYTRSSSKSLNSKAQRTRNVLLENSRNESCW